jgi:hypothetical protein
MILEVRNSNSASIFLGENGFPGYRAALLLRYASVVVGRAGESARPLVYPGGLEFRLRSGDRVIIPDVLPAAYEQALAAIPETEYRDYAFVPGTTSFENQMRVVCSQRPQTIVLGVTPMNSVEGFMRMLRTSPDIAGPVRDLLICSHANPEGRLILAFQTQSTAAGYVSYEELEGLCSSGVVRVPQEARLPRPRTTSGVRQMQVHVRGCRIGRSVPYLEKLRQALDVPMVTAPLFFHHPCAMDTPLGFGEYLEYSFEVYSRDRIATKSALVDAYVAQEHRTVDGAPITGDVWMRWINWTDINSSRTSRQQQVVNPVDNRNHDVRAPFRYSRRYLIEGGGSIGLAAEPTTEEDKKREVRIVLEREQPRYRASHLWPEYVRLGYDSMDAFMNGWNWNFSWRSDDNTLLFNPSRHEYILAQPVVTADNRLYMNFYYDDRSRQALIQLREDDNRFFGRAITP